MKKIRLKILSCILIATVVISNGFLINTYDVQASEVITSGISQIKGLKLKPGAQRINISWTPIKKVDGYQITYTTDSTFKTSVYQKNVSKATTAKTTIRQLSKDTVYYVRIRAYKRTGIGVTYGPDSSVKGVNVKDVIVVIDAGHQLKANNGKEPIGPGAKTKKTKVTSGTRGVATKIPEHKLNLTVSLKLQKELETRGYTVVMVRTSANVNITNIQRAKIANKAKADLFIRIHANGLPNSSAKGAFTMCMTKKNRYNKSLYKKSRRLSDCVIGGYCKSTGIKKKPVMEVDNMSGINWSKVPVTILEMGHMSNASEDKKLNSTKHQAKAVRGIANGIDNYFK